MAAWLRNRAQVRCLYDEASGAPEVQTSSSQEVDASGDAWQPGRVEWNICGVQVCFKVFCTLGTSGATLRKYIRGGVDVRKTTTDVPAAPRVGEQSAHCDWWFYELYQSAAEPLPTDSREPDDILRAMKDVEDPWLAPDFATNQTLDDWTPDRPTVDTMTRLTVASKSLVVGLPRRFLPHSRPYDLYWLFLAAWDTIQEPQASRGVQESSSPATAQTAPSWPTFWRRWKTVWSGFLRFRKSSQHAQCQTCFELQQALHSRKETWLQRVQAARSLREHYRHQYLDRCIYWSMRLASQRHGDILCIIIDSMDKSKFAWPRWSFDRVPKRLEALDRPRMVLTAALAHGYCGTMHVADELLTHGSDAFCEVLCAASAFERQARECHWCLGASKSPGVQKSLPNN